jgi:hypothetical protein
MDVALDLDELLLGLLVVGAVVFGQQAFWSAAYREHSTIDFQLEWCGLRGDGEDVLPHDDPGTRCWRKYDLFWGVSQNSKYEDFIAVGASSVNQHVVTVAGLGEPEPPIPPN